MKDDHFREIKKNWLEVAKMNTSTKFSYELEVHKKLLDMFHIGNYYYYIFNCATGQIEFTSELVKRVLLVNDVDELTTEFLIENMHPEDVPYFYDFELRVIDFLKQLPPDKILKYKMSYDYRVKRRDGKYIRILQQSITIQSDERGAVIRVLGIHTDITHIKNEETPSLSFIGLDGEPSYFDIATPKSISFQQSVKLTKREVEILQYIVDGKTSKEIADNLCISKLTVDRHRKNILQKTSASSTQALALMILNGITIT